MEKDGKLSPRDHAGSLRENDKNPARPRGLNGARIALVCWVFLAVFLTIDLRIGSKLYGSISWYDYTKHIAITSAMSFGTPASPAMQLCTSRGCVINART